MVEGRSDQAEGTIEEQLPGGGDQEVGTPDDLGDSHGGVVHHDGKLVGGRVVIPPDHKIAKVPAGDEPLGAAAEVGKPDLLTIRDPESPGNLPFALGGSRSVARAAGPGVRRLLVTRVGGRDRGSDVLARAGAGVEGPCLEKPLEGFAVEGNPLALDVGAVGAANVGPFLPVESEPSEVLAGRPAELVPAARPIEILDPHHESGRSGTRSRHGERPGMPHVQEAGGRRRQPPAQALRRAHEVLEYDDVKRAAHQRWGDEILGPDGRLDRAAIARIVPNAEIVRLPRAATRWPANVVRVAAAHPATATLGAMFGAINIEKAGEGK